MYQASRILVVDDEKNLRSTLADILWEEGFQVCTADSGPAAIDLCGRETFDTILMDVCMPGLDGVEAWRLVRRQQPEARILLMSAYGLADLQQQALDEGAIAWLSRPLHLEQVLRLIAEVPGTAVLTVEPDDVTAAIRNFLKVQGYRVAVTSCVHQALVIAEEGLFDIVFIAAPAPAANGQALHLGIKKLTPGTVAIMIAGGKTGKEHAPRPAVEPTAYALVAKPLDLDQVLPLLERLGVERSADVLHRPLPL